MVKMVAPAVLCLIIVVGVKAADRVTCRSQKTTFTETINPDPDTYERCNVTSSGLKICRYKEIK